ncbi:MAG: type II toxin-antitoxin system VapC family toxin [Deltaproteobacteria bacterium]|nr:type II toxin-antitoxin system VapC family toxin [Deltaproteobacteria bacterium]
MPTVLIDTDIAIDFLRGQSYAKNLIVPLWDSDAAYLSVLSVYELYAGMKENEKQATRDFVQAFRLEWVTPEIAVKGGELFQTYRKKGLTITAIDCLIGSTALLKGHKIATRNLSHYPDKEHLFKIKLSLLKKN